MGGVKECSMNFSLLVDPLSVNNNCKMMMMFYLSMMICLNGNTE